MHVFDYGLHLGLGGVSLQGFLTLGMADGQSTLVGTSIICLVNNTLVILVLVHKTALIIQRGCVSFWAHISLNSQECRMRERGIHRLSLLLEFLHLLIAAALLLTVIINRLYAGIPVGLPLHPAPFGPREYGIIDILAFLHGICFTDASVGGLARIDGSLDHDLSQDLLEVSVLPIVQRDARVDLQLVLLPVLICREVF